MKIAVDESHVSNDARRVWWSVRAAESAIAWNSAPMPRRPVLTNAFLVFSLDKSSLKTGGLCTALMVGCDDVASCYSVGVLTRRQVDSWGGSREARVVADS